MEEFDPYSRLQKATKRAKSDVANKLISMFLHLLSQKLCDTWGLKVGDSTYLDNVRKVFSDSCPYCRTLLMRSNVVVEHPDGMNRLRAGLHVPGNVLLACKPCNSEKRRDDSLETLTLAESGWESFLSHDGTHCPKSCLTCTYWREIWPEENERAKQLRESVKRIRQFRAGYPEFQQALPYLKTHLPQSLTKLYKDCQSFAGTQIEQVMNEFLKGSPFIKE